VSRYDLPDPTCRHKPTRRVSSHEDLRAGYESGEPFASTHVCDRDDCLNDAMLWLWASTRRPDVHIVPLSGKETR
jgi:hypothetical protein